MAKQSRAAQSKVVQKLVTDLESVALQAGEMDGPAHMRRMARAVKEAALEAVPGVLANLLREAEKGNWKASVEYLKMFLLPVLAQQHQRNVLNPYEASEQDKASSALDTLALTLVERAGLDVSDLGDNLEDKVELLRIRVMKRDSPLQPGGVTGMGQAPQPEEEHKAKRSLYQGKGQSTQRLKHITQSDAENVTDAAYRDVPGKEAREPGAQDVTPEEGRGHAPVRDFVTRHRPA